MFLSKCQQFPPTTSDWILIPYSLCIVRKRICILETFDLADFASKGAAVIAMDY